MDYSKLNLEFQSYETDVLYHLGIDSSTNLEEQFGDVKFIVLTRSFDDADYFANQFAKRHYDIPDTDIKCKTIAKDERYHIYKIANTLIISHGVGSPSMLICLNEVVKLLCHAKAKDFQFIRLSTGGGIGLAENSLLVAHNAVNSQFKHEWSNIEFGGIYTYDTQIHNTIAEAIINANPNMNIATGEILHTSSFYNGQARLNGALPTSFNQQERNEYLNKAYNLGIRGIDMESGCFAAFCALFNIPAAIVLAIIIDRLNNDRIDATHVMNNENIEIAIAQATNAIINYIKQTI